MKAELISGVDFFRNARSTLEERRRELTACGAPTPAAAGDILGMVRLGIVSGDDESAIIARDVRLLELVSLVEANEDGAARDLHGYLSDALLTGFATPTMCTLLAAMHNALSRGLPAEDAMRVKPPAGAGRPKKIRRDEDIRRYVRSHLFQMPGMAKPDPAAVYREASRIFEVSIKTIKNVCAAA